MLHIANYSLYLPRIQLTLLMRHISFLSVIASILFLVSCHPEVDLFADYKEVPVIYGLLDADADTNFILIKRAFLSENAMYYAAIPDSTSYPGRLDARLVEYVDGEKLREIILDTITKCNKEPGVFPSPKQKMYYTAEKLHGNTAKHEYSYRLLVAFKDWTLEAKTIMVGGSDFAVWSRTANFSMFPDEAYPSKMFFYPALHGAMYQVTMEFSFGEQRGDDGDTVTRTMSCDWGVYDANELNFKDGKYYLNYSWRTFYANLREFLGADTVPIGIKRYISDWPVTFYVCAGGREMLEYNMVNGASGTDMQAQLDYSPIDGGIGLFSSRSFREQRARLAGNTVPELVEKGWGFKFIGGE